ncbi:unnamed protein product [Effrenium voratum]|nr:unnamed protein product [Effrenium voratum]
MEDPTLHKARPAQPIWTHDAMEGQLHSLVSELSRLRAELAAHRRLAAEQGLKVEEHFEDEEAAHGSTLFLTMCAGKSYFELYCGPFFASFERAYGAAVLRHQVVAFTVHVSAALQAAAAQRFAPWGRFEALTRYVSEVEGPDGGTEQHYGEDSETESGAITCFRTSKGRLACNVPEHGQETRDTKTQLDSLWFPQAVAAYLDGHGKNFDFAVLMDSDTLFVGPLGRQLAPTVDWDVAFTVYDPAMKVPWSDNPAEAGGRPKAMPASTAGWCS